MFRCIQIADIWTKGLCYQVLVPLGINKDSLDFKNVAYSNYSRVTKCYTNVYESNLQLRELCGIGKQTLWNLGQQIIAKMPTRERDMAKHDKLFAQNMKFKFTFVDVQPVHSQKFSLHIISTGIYKHCFYISLMLAKEKRK